MRLVYFGSGPLGLPTLGALAAGHEVRLVVTQPDRPAGRRRHLRPTPVREHAETLGLPTHAAEDVNATEVVGRVEEAEAEALVVIAFGQKLGPDLLAGPPALNLHASLLPKYRGAAPINWAMINGERETGLSVIRMTKRIDAGGVVGQRATAIDPMETAGELSDRLAQMGPELVMDVLDAVSKGTLQDVPQDESAASRAPKLTKADGTVRFDQPAAQVRQRVHGLTPWPGCRVRVDGRELRLARVAETAGYAGLEPGELVTDGDGAGEVACKPGGVRLVEVQPPGGRLMPFASWLRGNRPSPGARVEPL
jgi:methionyl-tRNA formyltransferase